MLSGFNTNIRHRGVLFHVQTEDSGYGNPQVITHLFYGGNIMASEKRSYADKLESANLEAEVRVLMESQHKAMLKRLTRGEYDPGIEARLGAGTFGDSADSVATLPPPAGDLPRAGTVGPPTSPPVPPREESPKEKLARAFGDGVVSQKPLDEVVLEYLVENARKRKRSAK